MKMTQRKTKLKIYTHHSLLKPIQNFLRLSYIFKERTEFPLDFFTYEFEEEILVSSGLTFIARGNTHLKKYKHDPFLSRASSSFLFIYGSKNVYYSGDIGTPEDLLIFKNFHIDVFITEATHLNIYELANIYEKLRPEKIVLTHLSDDYAEEIKLKSAALKEIPLIIAEDGMTLSVRFNIRNQFL
jgi:ribonuclease BN (tRNA processing enzyme)